jgi:2-dehydropantoate 2-reductase
MWKEKQMKVAVVGPGATGCLFAARLASNGTRVHLVDHRQNRADHLEKNGVTLEDNEGGRQTVHPTVITHIPTGMDLILVMVKAHHTSSLRFPPETPVLTLQNGLGNVETLCAAVGSARVLAGTTSEAATLLEDGVTRHAAAGVTRLGSWTSCSCEPAFGVLKQAGFNVEITESPGQIIWEKTAINAGVNPLSAILNVPNGELLNGSEVRQLLRDLVVEATKVASTEGYRFSHSLVESAEDLCRKTGNNISSMLQDIRAGRKTEIDAISGEILRRAQAACLNTPRTRVIYQLIRGLEQS